MPDGLKLVYLPPYSPELQPAETLWPSVDEPIVNRLVPTLDALVDTIGAPAAAISPSARVRSVRVPTCPGGPEIMHRPNLAKTVSPWPTSPFQTKRPADGALARAVPNGTAQRLAGRRGEADRPEKLAARDRFLARVEAEPFRTSREFFLSG